MNSIKWFALVVAILILGNLEQTGRASGKPRKKSPPPPPARVALAMDDVEGNGESADKARKQAKENAVRRVEEMLKEKFERFGWQPAAEHLDPTHLEQLKVIQPVGEPEEGRGVEGLGPVNFKATYHVELTPKYLDELVSEARQVKMEERHLLLLRVLGGILAFVLVAAGYLRLEESTRGYATKLLRLAAVVLLAIVAAGLYLTR